MIADKIIIAVLVSFLYLPVSAQTKKADSTGGEPTALSQSFAQNFGKLCLPVQGRLFSHNSHSHPPEGSSDLSVDIIALTVQDVLAAFDGIVTEVLPLAKDRTMVVLQHGQYETVYNGVTNLKITKGTVIKKGQTIGTLARDERGNLTLNFRIIVNKKRELDAIQSFPKIR